MVQGEAVLFPIPQVQGHVATRLQSAPAALDGRAPVSGMLRNGCADEGSQIALHPELDVEGTVAVPGGKLPRGEESPQVIRTPGRVAV